MPSLLPLGIIWLHLLAASVWLGGLAFQAWVVMPLWSRNPSRERLRFVLSLEAGFRVVMWPAVGLVLFTGLVNLVQSWSVMSAEGVRLPASFVWLLGVKVGLVVLMLILQMLQQFVLRPRRLAVLSEAATADGMVSARAQRLQQVTALLASVLLLLGAVVLGCGVLLRAV